MQPVVVKQVTQVCGGGCPESKPWVVQSSEMLGGIQYVQLSKSDSGFNRFVTGSYAGLRLYHGLHKLTALRTEAYMKEVQGMKDEMGAPGSAYAQRKAFNVAKGRHGSIDVVELEAPDVEHEEESIKGRNIKVLVPATTRSNIFVECKASNLEYIRFFLLADGPNIEPKPKKSPKRKRERAADQDPPAAGQDPQVAGEDPPSYSDVEGLDHARELVHQDSLE